MKLKTIKNEWQIKIFGKVVIPGEAEFNVESYKSGFKLVTDKSDFPTVYPREAFEVKFAKSPINLISVIPLILSFTSFPST